MRKNRGSPQPLFLPMAGVDRTAEFEGVLASLRANSGPLVTSRPPAPPGLRPGASDHARFSATVASITAKIHATSLKIQEMGRGTRKRTTALRFWARGCAGDLAPLALTKIPFSVVVSPCAVVKSRGVGRGGGDSGSLTASIKNDIAQLNAQLGEVEVRGRVLMWARFHGLLIG